MYVPGAMKMEPGFSYIEEEELTTEVWSKYEVSANDVNLFDLDVAGRKKLFKVVPNYLAGMGLSLAVPFTVCYPCHPYLLCQDEGKHIPW